MANGEEIAGNVLGGIAPALNFVPYVGPLLSMGATIGAGFLEKDAAKKQAEQAANLRKEQANLLPEPIRKEYLQKLNADEFAAQGGLPGMDMYRNALQNTFANHMKQIREASPTGEATLAAIAAASGGENAAVNDLNVKDAEYRAGLQKDVRQDLWNIGDKQRANELQRDEKQKDILSQANNLEAASTANKQTAYNTILGSIGNTATAITGQINTDNTNKMWADWFKMQNAKNGTPTTTATTNMDNTYGTYGNGQPNMMNNFQLMSF